MIHVINFLPIPTMETWLETLKTQKGYYDPEKIHKRSELKTQADGYNRNKTKIWRKNKASKSVSPTRSRNG